MDAHPAQRVRTVGGLRRRVAACRLCGTAVSGRPVLWALPGQRALLVGQAPGAVEADSGLPFQGAAGRRLREWLAPVGLGTEERFLATLAVAAVAKCYPGPHPGGRGDRVPTPQEIARCRPWTDAAVRLLDPVLVIPVGRLAIAQWLPGAGALDQVVGRRSVVDGRAVIPLPHPSGASSWANGAANRALIAQAVELIGEELERLGRDGAQTRPRAAAGGSSAARSARATARASASTTMRS